MGRPSAQSALHVAACTGAFAQKKGPQGRCLPCDPFARPQPEAAVREVCSLGNAYPHAKAARRECMYTDGDKIGPVTKLMRVIILKLSLLPSVMRPPEIVGIRMFALDA